MTINHQTNVETQPIHTNTLLEQKKNKKKSLRIPKKFNFHFFQTQCKDIVYKKNSIKKHITHHVPPSKNTLNCVLLSLTTHTIINWGGIWCYVSIVNITINYIENVTNHRIDQNISLQLYIYKKNVNHSLQFVNKIKKPQSIFHYHLLLCG